MQECLSILLNLRRHDIINSDHAVCLNFNVTWKFFDNIYSLLRKQTSLQIFMICIQHFIKTLGKMTKSLFYFLMQPRFNFIYLSRLTIMANSWIFIHDSFHDLRKISMIHGWKPMIHRWKPMIHGLNPRRRG